MKSNYNETVKEDIRFRSAASVNECMDINENLRNTKWRHGATRPGGPNRDSL